MSKRIFLDYAAGRDNPNAIYKEGREAKAKLELARKKIAGVLSVATDEIVLTGWGTDANRTAITGAFEPQGLALASPRRGLRAQVSHAITTMIEHKSVLDVFKELESEGIEVIYMKPNSDGLVSAKQVSDALRPNTKLVSIMYANNEIGTIQSIKEISRVLRRVQSESQGLALASPRRGLRAQVRPIFHSDCVQAPGLLPINMQSLGVDIATFSALKFGGPAGVGFMYLRRGTWSSGLQVRDSSPVELAVEMADQFVYVEKRREREVARLTKLRDYFIAGVLDKIRASQLCGSRQMRLANNANFVFPIEAELLVLELDRYGIAASAGAACENNSQSNEGSHVILALPHRSRAEAGRSVRFSLGGETSKLQLDYVIKKLVQIINKHSNLWQKK